MWNQLTFVTSANAVEELENLLSENDCLSITLMDDGDEPILEPALGTHPLWSQVRLLALFEAVDLNSTESIKYFQQRLLNLQNSIQNLAAPCELVRQEELADEAWERRWIQYAKPMQFDQLWVVPSHCINQVQDEIDPQSIILQLDPGLAFGTGTHPTTSLCLSWLARTHLKGKRILDFGCGSGILGIAAQLLGAADVVFLDIDPQALIATQDNATINSIDLKPQQLCLPEDILPIGTFDIVIANILLNPLLELRDRFCELLAPHGTLVVSGLLEHQDQELRDHYTVSTKNNISLHLKNNFHNLKQHQQGDWLLISMEKQP
ncbi:MAG: 50S ribosomal protein L11 methyltransferase [Pseudomonadota bacterium]